MDQGTEGKTSYPNMGNWWAHRWWRTDRKTGEKGCSHLALTRDLIASATFLPLATFLFPMTLGNVCTWFIQNIPQILKLTLAPITPHPHASHTPIPPSHLTPSPCFYLHWLTDLFSYAPTNHPTIIFKPFSDLQHRIKSFAYKRPGNFSTL